LSANFATLRSFQIISVIRNGRPPTLFSQHTLAARPRQALRAQRIGSDPTAQVVNQAHERRPATKDGLNVTAHLPALDIVAEPWARRKGLVTTSRRDGSVDLGQGGHAEPPEGRGRPAGAHGRVPARMAQRGITYQAEGRGRTRALSSAGIGRLPGSERVPHYWSPVRSGGAYQGESA
jgi:hypothetical protein